ncbi:hypothetical protein EON81_17590 [bacterium]|nr:MAG: hypothetical protein EON81_17590 [bacterium]
MAPARRPRRLARSLLGFPLDRSLSSGELRLEIDASGVVSFIDTARSERLIVAPSLAFLVPSGEVTVEGISKTGRGFEARVRSADFEAKVEILAAQEGLIFGSEIVPKRDLELQRLAVLPSGTELNLYDVVNYRNRHYTPNTWPELLLGGRGCETDTFSRDWQFAPHPSMMMLRKEETAICFGALDLPTSFGLYLKASDFRVDELALEYGGLLLPVGTPFCPPRFTLFLDHGRTPDETAAAYTGRLVEEGVVPDPAEKTRYGWHRDPVYCTWMDQGFVARETPADELGEQQLTGSNPTVEALDESFVRESLAKMDVEGLKFGIYLLDDGWQVTRGQWDAHPERFPDLRGVVDEIHARGMKVIVWWNWAEVFDNADVDPNHVAGGDWRNAHGRRVRDYSKPATQEEYFKPFFRKLFSSDPDCYDFDGFKSDFLADKVHPEMPLHDPEWRGEENYAYRLFELCYRTMRTYKPDGCHIGCAGHPYLAEFIDINRTYDVATSNYREHENRSKMLKALTPGCPVAYDLHNFIERFEEYFESTRRSGDSFHIGNIFGMRIDRLSPWEPADERHFEPMRDALAKAFWSDGVGGN